MNHHPLPTRPHPHDLKAVISTFKALGEATRVRLVLALGRGEQAVGELVEQLSAPQSTVSRHLGVLRAARLVQTRREGTMIYYRLADAHLADLVRQAFAHAEHERLGLPDHDAPGARTQTNPAKAEAHL